MGFYWVRGGRRCAWTFDVAQDAAGEDILRVFTEDSGALSLYDPENSKAYLACEEALDLSEWA